jgi:hypothetical protein
VPVMRVVPVVHVMQCIDYLLRPATAYTGST